jgi:hypothetical protein
VQTVGPTAFFANATWSTAIIEHIKRAAPTLQKGTEAEATPNQCVDMLLGHNIPMPRPRGGGNGASGVAAAHIPGNTAKVDGTISNLPTQELWPAKYPDGWRLNIGNYLLELGLTAEAVLTPQKAKQLGGRRLQKQKEAESFATFGSSSVEAIAWFENCSPKHPLVHMRCCVLGRCGFRRPNAQKAVQGRYRRATSINGPATKPNQFITP